MLVALIFLYPCGCWVLAPVCLLLGMIIHLSFISMPSITAKSFWRSSVPSASANFHFCLVTNLIWCSLLAVVGDHPGVLLAVSLVLACILGCLLPCVWHQYLSSCQTFFHLCLLYDTVMTTSLILNGGFSVICIEISMIAWLYLFWILLPVACDL